jgi:hypothetical protein
MLDEMTAIEANETWKLEEAPAGICPIGLKWVFKTKRDAASNISKYKARLVAKDTCSSRAFTSMRCSRR